MAEHGSVVSPADAVARAVNDGKVHVLLASSGSVATIKLPLIAAALSSYPNISIRIILTKSAAHFLSGQSEEQPTVASLFDIPNVDGVHLDEDEWIVPWTRGGSILHIELRRWANLLLIAPLSANTLAKIVNGMADNLLTSVVRCWDISPDNPRRPRILVAPAMNTQMWIHPITASQITKLVDEWGVNGRTPSVGWYEVLQPQASKLLACGDRGSGAMLDWNEIVAIVKDRLSSLCFGFRVGDPEIILLVMKNLVHKRRKGGYRLVDAAGGRDESSIVSTLRKR